MIKKRLIIGYGTGRCGSKSLAAFLNQQSDVMFTHENLVSFYPQWGDYFRYMTLLAKYRASFVGNISPGWIEYIDRIMVDFPQAKFICLTREDPEEVASSFYSYLKDDWVSGNSFLTYPVFDNEITRAAILRTVRQFMYKQDILWPRLGPRVFRMETDWLNDQHHLERLLAFLEIPEPWNLEMPWLNKREDMRED